MTKFKYNFTNWESLERQKLLQSSSGLKDFYQETKLLLLLFFLFSLLCIRYWMVITKNLEVFDWRKYLYDFINKT